MPPKEVTLHTSPEEVVFDFPRRPLGAQRWLGVIPLVLAASALWFIVDFIGGVFASGAPRVFLFAMSCFMLLFAFPVLKAVGLGLAIIGGRTRIIISEDRCQVTEIVGFLRWSRSIRLNRIQSLITSSLQNLKSDASTQADLSEFVKRLGALQVELSSFKQKFLVVGYPDSWIALVAAHLQHRLAVMGNAATTVESSGEGALVMTAHNDRPPAGTDIIMKREPGVLEIYIPAGPTRPHTALPLSFGIIWSLLSLILTLVALRSWIAGTSSPSAIPAPLVVLPFLLAGLTLTGVCLHYAARKTIIRTERRTLTITQSSWLYKNQRAWNFDEIRGIGQRRSNVSVNNQRLQDLAIKPNAGKIQGYLRGRTLAELAWVSSSLSIACGIAPQTPPTSAS
jgi:hypothetical protein